jgi:hypothetical protein
LTGKERGGRNGVFAKRSQFLLAKLHVYLIELQRLMATAKTYSRVLFALVLTHIKRAIAMKKRVF